MTAAASPTDPPTERSVRSRPVRPSWWGIAALVVLGLVVAVVVALFTFTHAHRTVTVGAHTAVASPTFDGHATLDLGSVLPRVRMPVDAPFDVGVHLVVGETQGEGFEDIIARDAVIASQPDAEIESIAGVVKGIALASVMRGVGAGLAVVLLVLLARAALGRRRREQLADRFRSALHGARPPHRTVRAAVAGGLAAVLALVLLTWPEPDDDDAPAVAWEPIRSVYPEIPDDPKLASIQITTGSATDATRSLVESAFKTYEQSVGFYGDMRERVPEISAQLRQPTGDEKVALLVSDRHDNIGMDPILRDVADAAQASILIDAGDDTSTGGSWEAFSLRSLAKQFTGYDKVSVAGNHDEGPYVAKQMDDLGFTVLDGKPVDVAGIRFLGYSDPRSSGFTKGWTQGGSSIYEQGAELTKTACEDGRVSTIVVHSPTTGREAAQSGCVDLVVAGHLHVQQGPEVLTGSNGLPTATFTNGTTGGAAFAFALGSKLRRTAQATLVTYREDGVPAGLQPINFVPDGTIQVEQYVPFTLPRDDERPSPSPEPEPSDDASPSATATPSGPTVKPSSSASPFTTATTP